MESFETDFITGDNSEFIPNWTGNEVAGSNRIFKSEDVRTGAGALGIIPTSSFDGEVLISLDMTMFENAQISFYAKSNQNGNANSTRPTLVFFSVSIDGGVSFGESTQIGDETTFPNSDGETFNQYFYDLDAIADDETEVVVRLIVERGSGSGSSAEFVMDDVEITAYVSAGDIEPPVISHVIAVSSTMVEVIFDEAVDELTSEMPSNYLIGNNISVLEASLDDSDNSMVHLTTTSMINGSSYVITINNIQDVSGNVITANSTFNFEFIELEEAVPGDIVINEFLSDPVESNDDFVELYNRSNKFISLNGWKLRDKSSTSSGFDDFLLRPNTYVIIYDKDATIDYDAFGDAIAIPSLTLNNDDDQIEILDDLENQIVFLSYEETEEGISLELINPDDPCISFNSYTFSNAPSGSTPGQLNSMFDDTPDILAPTIISSSYDSKLTILFSEVLTASNFSGGSFSIAGLRIDRIHSEEFSYALDIVFEKSPLEGVAYEILIWGIEDCWGNVMEPTSIAFGIGRSPSFNELIITEIYFDPDPSLGLPETEWIEFHNPTNDLITTSGIDLIDATSTTRIPDFTLSPDDYYVVTSSTDGSEFEGMNVVEVSGFPSLNNTGEQLLLLKADTLIFSIAYSPQWHDEDKDDGGVSLEMKDVSNPCVEELNWGSSIDPMGGTPGRPNSIQESIPDNFGPEVIDVIAIASDTFRVDLNEKIDPISTKTVAVDFSPELEVDTTFFKNELPASIYLVIEGELQESDPYTVALRNVFDCNGNEIQENETAFALPTQASKGEILLSEVLFNPRTNGVDFVEIFNNSNKYLSLKDWQLARITSSGIGDEEPITEEEFVVSPSEILAFTTDPDLLFSNYPKGHFDQFVEVDKLPAYSNDTGNVVLLNTLGEVHELFHYEEDFHYDLLESVDGVSLERISYSGDTNDPNNWRSASSTEGFATPGYENSQRKQVSSISNNLSIDPKIFIPGNAGSGRDFTTINYRFDNPGLFANVRIYDQSGRLVKTLLEGASISTSGFLRWDGTSNTGTMARLGYYIVLFEVYDQDGNTDVFKETVVVGRDF